MEKTSISSAAVRQVLKDYWLQYKTYPFTTAPSFVLPAIGTILTNFIPPLIIARLVNLVAAGDALTVNSVGQLVLLFAGSWILGETLWRIGLHLVIKLETDGMNNLGKTAFSRLTSRDHDFYSENFVGSLTKHASTFARGFEALTDTLIFNIVTNIFPLIFATIVLWQFSPFIPLILFISLAIMIAITIPVIRRRAKLVAARHQASSKVSGRISDSLTNILAVKSFAKEKTEQRILGEYLDDYAQKFRAAANYQNLRLDTLVSPMYVTTNTLGLVGALFFTAHLGLQAGTMVIIFSYFQQITRMFWEIGRIYRNLESSVSEAAELTQLTMNPPAVMDIENAPSLHVSDARIEFRDVAFAYKGQKEGGSFLSQFNLDIKSNQRVGLVGPSGGGKTTITKLLLRFIDLQSGEITIDGQNISKISQKSLRDSIAYVPQEPLLFHRTLFENIAYGNDDATEADVLEAAKLARADEFIDVLPNGYQTLVGERGIKLSGGQRQRIAIARALLKKSPILVLDEATSALDSESEKYIQEGLWELMKNKTALVIAHRLSTIKHLDRIIVLEDGKIVQDGTHEELISQKGMYAKLWGHQSGEFLEE